MGRAEDPATSQRKSIADMKAGIRYQCRKALARMSSAERRTCGERAVARLARLRELRRARTIAIFVPRPDEPPIHRLAAMPAARTRQWAVPAWDARLQRYRWALWRPDAPSVPGPFGIPQPARPRWISARQIDLVIVPGLAFDRLGDRLGRGGGHYDRLLAGCRCPAIGIAPDAFLLDRLPAEPHDRRMDGIVTDRRTLRARPRPPIFNGRRSR